MRDEELIGKHIKNAYFNNGNIYLQCNQVKTYCLEPEGDCCAHAYVNAVNGADALIDATITSIEDLEFSSNGDGDYSVIDVWGHRIHTTKGICTLDMRTEHNGYYGGWLKINLVETVPDNSQQLQDKDYHAG